MYCSLHHNSNLIGIFENIESCENFLVGLKNNNLVKKLENFSVKQFHKNTINQVNELFFDSKKLIFIEKNKKKQEKKLTKEEEEKIKKKKKEIFEKKTEIEIKKNRLNMQKAKIDNSKSIYKNDIKLFKKFKKMLEKNSDFMIPEMFQNKFILFTKLENDDKLSWENFYLEYKHESFDNEYSGLF